MARRNFRLHKRAILIAAVSACYPLTAPAQPAAVVFFTSGQVTATAADGNKRALAKGSDVSAGDTISTGAGSWAQLRFADGATTGLQPNTQFRIDQYHFDGKADGTEKGFFSLLKGGLRTLTGLIGHVHHDKYRLNTTVAQIGIRGTGYTAHFEQTLTITNSLGEIVVCNGGGCIELSNGDTGYVQNGNTIGQLVSSKLSLLPPPPVRLTTGFIASQDQRYNGVTELGALNDLGNVAGENRGANGSTNVVTPPPPVTSYTITPTAVAFSAPGVDPVYPSTSATFDASGKLIAFQDAAGGTVTIGTAANNADQGAQAASIPVAGNDGTVSWGRWSGGITGGDGVASNIDLTNGSLSYVVGLPTAAADLSELRTGRIVASYSLLGATLPSSSTGAVGQVTEGSLSADFGSGLVDANLALSFGSDVGYSMTADGLLISGTTFGGSGNYTFGGSDCADGCPTTVTGFFAGSNAARAGLSYDVQGTGIGAIQGAAVFTQGTTTPLLTGTITSVDVALADSSGVADFIAGTSVTFNTSGQLVSFVDAESGTNGIGTATLDTAQGTQSAAIPVAGNDGIIGWGRWTDGTTDGDGQYSGWTLGAEGGGLHFVAGVPTPAGDLQALQTANVTATYSLLGATHPDGWFGQGDVTSGSLTARFGSGQVDAHLGINVSGEDFALAATNLPISGSSFSGGGSTTSMSMCSGGCDSSVQGFFSGANATRAGISYSISGGGLQGAAAFKKN
ncbi:MAG TPA: FecR domain-containing protein [Burkholderiales bacterium]|nr:FecR domain-containing protein [Burkholderiales bacterium]